MHLTAAGGPPVQGTFVRPRLKPGLRTVWRDSATLQIGLDPERAVVIGGVSAGDARVVAALDGSSDLAAVVALGAGVGVSEDRVTRLIALLRDGGALIDAAGATGTWRSRDLDERDRLRPDVVSSTLTSVPDAGGHAAFDRRGAASVLVEGAGRVGAAIATLLAAAGIGTVAVRDDGLASRADAGPAGLPPSAAGSRRADAVRSAIRRAAPKVRTSLPRTMPTPQVVILAPVTGFGRGAADAWLRADVPHLYAGVRETLGVVGPFVLPGRSSCLHCADLHRTDRDPSWPAVASQLVGSEPGGASAAACDVALATLVGAQAALQVLAFLDGGELPPAVGATLETRLPGGTSRRRAWAPHPACGCIWERAG